MKWNYLTRVIRNGELYSVNMPDDCLTHGFTYIEDAVEEFATRCIVYAKAEQEAIGAAKENTELVEVFLIERGMPLDVTLVHKSFVCKKKD